MLIFNSKMVGNSLYKYRKSSGLTQAEFADLAGISDRTYAAIERGSTNMRIDTLLKICDTMKITPNDILTAEDNYKDVRELESLVFKRLNICSEKEKETAYNILDIYLKSL